MAFQRPTLVLEDSHTSTLTPETSNTPASFLTALISSPGVDNQAFQLGLQPYIATHLHPNAYPILPLCSFVLIPEIHSLVCTVYVFH